MQLLERNNYIKSMYHNQSAEPNPSSPDQNFQNVGAQPIQPPPVPTTQLQQQLQTILQQLNTNVQSSSDSGTQNLIILTEQYKKSKLIISFAIAALLVIKILVRFEVELFDVVFFGSIALFSIQDKTKMFGTLKYYLIGCTVSFGLYIWAFFRMFDCEGLEFWIMILYLIVFFLHDFIVMSIILGFATCCGCCCGFLIAIGKLGNYSKSLNKKKKINDLFQNLKDMKKYEQNEQQAQSFDGENEECAICYVTKKEESKNIKTGCGHRYHWECLSKWLQTADNCPICRKVLLK